MTTTAGTPVVPAVVVLAIVAVVGVAAVRWVRRCLVELRETPDAQLRHLTRAGWTAVIVCVIPVGGLLFLSFGRDA